MLKDDKHNGEFRRTVWARLLSALTWCVVATIIFWCLSALGYLALTLVFFRYSLRNWPALPLWLIAVFCVAAIGPLTGALLSSKGNVPLRRLGIAAAVVGVVAGVALGPATTTSVETIRVFMTQNPLVRFHETVTATVCFEFVAVLLVVAVAQCLPSLWVRGAEAGPTRATAPDSPVERDAAHNLRDRKWMNALLGLKPATLFAILLAAFTWWATEHTARCLQDKMCKRALTRLASAVREYTEAEGCLPPAYGDDDVSWRVRVLRFMVLDHVALYTMYDNYDKERPWNSRENEWALRSFHAKVTFCCLARDDAWKFGAYWTSYVAVVGEQTFWPDREARCIREMTPEIEAKILLVEVPDPDFPWTKPEDITVDQAVQLYREVHAGRYRRHPEGLYYVTFGGTVAPLSSIPSEQEFREMLRVQQPESVQQ